MSFGDAAELDFTTAHARGWPSVRQFNVFLANRMGAMLDLVRCFESTEVPIVSLMVIETSDCAIIRLVLGDYDKGFEVLTAAKYPFTESELLVVKLPDNNKPLLTITKALLSGEINLNYIYPLMIGIGPMGNTALAIHVHNPEAAATALQKRGFTLFGEEDLKDDLH